MFKNNLKIAWRHLIKDRQFTFLNVIGLSAGLACALLIWLWVSDELSFDKFFKQDSQLYQLMEHRKASDGPILISDESSGILGEAMALRVPEIEYAAAVAPADWWPKFTLSAEEKNIKATGQYVGKDYFNIFSFKLVDGKQNTVLADKNSIVISDELAVKLFGTTKNIIGKPIRFQHERDFYVSGIFEKPPYHSSQQFDFVLSFEYLKDTQSWVKTWNNTGPHNFVLLKKGTDIIMFNKKIASFIKESSGDTSRLALAMHFSDNYLQNNFIHGSRTGGKMEYVRLFSLVAIFILFIACINFMNLSTAKAAGRLKEVGIKKTVGAGRYQLIVQFLTESVLLTIFSMLLALVIAWMLLPAFNQLTGKQISLIFDTKLIEAIIAVTVTTGLLAGSYPALYLSGFNPVKILKGSFQSSVAELLSRKGLVVFQFTLSTMLIIAVLVVYNQVQFIQRTNPGFTKDNVVRFSAEGKIQDNEEGFVTALRKLPGVINASSTFNNMVGRNYGDNGIGWPGKPPNEYVYFEGFRVGYDLIETMGMQLAAGRSYSKYFGDERTKIIVNETAASLMHVKDPLGKTITLFGQPRQIIGIVKDFHFESLHEPVRPAYLVLSEYHGVSNKIMVRLKAGQEKQAIAGLQHLYESYNPGFPFEFNFLDEAYQQQYVTETRASALAGYFAGLAILISCLGLFGLAAFTAQKRQKEIGIRKIVGASVKSIALMLSADFLKLVLIAIFIAFPLAWWAMYSWLQSFAYRISIEPRFFLMAGLSVVLITIVTIGYQAIRAAVANPVKSLRTE